MHQIPERDGPVVLGGSDPTSVGDMSKAWNRWLIQVPRESAGDAGGPGLSQHLHSKSAHDVQGEGLPILGKEDGPLGDVETPQIRVDEASGTFRVSRSQTSTVRTVGTFMQVGPSPTAFRVVSSFRPFTNQAR